MGQHGGARTRTNWFLDDLEADGPEQDVFARVESLGSQLDLTADIDQIAAKLQETLEVESGLFAKKIICVVKDDPSAACSACQVRHTADDDPMRALCDIGIEQEKLLTRAACARAGII